MNRERIEIEEIFDRIEATLETVFPAHEDKHTFHEDVIKIANAVHEYPDDEHQKDSLWNIGEHTGLGGLSELIAGLYWAYTEWHAGQESIEYAALCALGQVFQPGMSDGPEEDSPEAGVYESMGTFMRNGPGDPAELPDDRKVCLLSYQQDIILSALSDYRKWFAEDADDGDESARSQVEEIDEAILRVEKLL